MSELDKDKIEREYLERLNNPEIQKTIRMKLEGSPSDQPSNISAKEAYKKMAENIKQNMKEIELW